MTTPCEYEGVCRDDCPRRGDDCDGNPELMPQKQILKEGDILIKKSDKKRYKVSSVFQDGEFCLTGIPYSYIKWCDQSDLNQFVIAGNVKK